MTPPAILDLQPTLRPLGAVADNWLNPADVFRRQALEGLQLSTGYSSTLIGSAIDAAFGELTLEKLQSFYKAEPAFRRSPRLNRKVLHILPANVFTAWLPGAFTTLLLGQTCWLKPSMSEPVFPALWRKSVAQTDLALAERIRVVAWDKGLFDQANAVIAYGSDETLKNIGDHVPADKLFIAYGHKISVAIVTREALADRQRVFDAAWRDIAPFRLQGCLSPQILFVEGSIPSDFRLAGPQGQPVPQLQSFSTMSELMTELRKIRPVISTVGVAGSVDQWSERLKEFRFSRICGLGEMQRPPVDWRNGGFSLAERLSAP